MFRVKKWLKYIICFILYYSGIVALIRKFQGRKKTFRILVYHRVSDAPEGSAPSISRKRFKRQLKYLKRYYRILSLNQIAESLKRDKEIVPASVAITFDDGYRDVFINAYPIIKELNVPITVFLASDCMGNNKMLWTDMVYFSFKEKSDLKKFYAFKESLKYLDNKERMKIVEDLDIGFKENLMLSWEEVLELSRDDNVEIGSHTRTHPILPNTDVAGARKEILESKTDLEQKIGRGIRGFSYPAGKFNQGIKDLVKGSGYDYACAVGNRMNNLDPDIYCLKRITIQNEPLFCFAVELCGMLNLFRKLFF